MKIDKENWNTTAKWRGSTGIKRETKGKQTTLAREWEKKTAEGEKIIEGEEEGRGKWWRKRDMQTEAAGQG